MEENIISAVAANRVEGPHITVVGVGGGGGNAVNHMWNLGIKDVEFMVCNTDMQALSSSPVECKILLGETGIGAGNDDSAGREAAIGSLDLVREQLERTKTRMLFIAAGMGKGTGTGASPVIAKLAREMGILTVAIVTLPLAVEGPLRYEQACRGVNALQEYVDSLLIINNERILEVYGSLSVKQAFGKADDILAAAAKGIAEIITVKSDLVNVDFADVRKVMRNSGKTLMSVAVGAGEHRAEELVEKALHSPLLDDNRIAGAKNILVNVAVNNSDNLKLDEVKLIMEYIQRYACTQSPQGETKYANIIWGTSVKPNLADDELELMVVVTGFEGQKRAGLTAAADGQPESVAAEAEESKTDEGFVTIPGKQQHYQAPTGVLISQTSRYKDMKNVRKEPAYKRHNVELIAEKISTRNNEVLVNEEETAAKPLPQPGLFDDKE